MNAGKLVAKSFVSGARYGLVSGCIALAASVISSLASGSFGDVSPIDFFFTFVTAFLIPILLLPVNTLVHSRRFIKRLPVIAVFAIDFAALVAISLAIALPLTYIGASEAIRSAPDFLQGQIQQILMLSFGIALILSSVAALISFVGSKSLVSLITGRYHRPKETESIIAFVDLVGSTEIAERLGRKGFFRLLNDYLSIVDMCCSYSDGEVYKYVGDGVIAVWRATASGARKSLDFLRILLSEISKAEPYFRKTYGIRVAVTIGMHAGKILVGEIGYDRREIGYFGDTINTASRIQGECRTQSAVCLVSRGVLDALDTGAAVHPQTEGFAFVGGIRLRGVAAAIDLYSLAEAAGS